MKRFSLTLIYTTWLLLAGMVGAQDAGLFRVVTDTTLNLRACPARDCARVGQVPGGTELAVHAVEDDWYQVRVDGEPVWLAGWLTTRLPEPEPTPEPTLTGARLLAMGETWTDAVTGCNLLVGQVAGEAGDLALLFAGEGREQLRLDVFQPGAAAPLPLAGARDSLADVMGNPIIIRTWPESVGWPAGRYRFELALGELSNAFEWEMPGPGEYSLLVDCGRPASAAGEFPPQLFLTGEVYRDRGDTGCNLFLNEGEGPAGIEVVFVGDRRREVRADLFLPDDNTALEPEPDRKYGQFEDGEAYVAQQYPRKTDWRTGLYRIELEHGDSGSAFVWHMERPGNYFLFVNCDAPASDEAGAGGEPVMLELEDAHIDPVTGCIIYLFPDSVDDDLNLLFQGERQRDIVARIYGPGDSRPLPFGGRQNLNFTDSGTPYIVQYYDAELDWPSGLYRLEVELDGRVSAFAWHMEAPRDQTPTVHCDEVPPDQEAADRPADPTPTPPGAREADEGDLGRPLFQVVTNGTLNLRACGGRDCARVGQVPGGTELPVFSIEGDWYEVLVNGELVWAAGWLTTRAPDFVLEDTSMMLDEGSGCTYLLGARQLFDVLHIMVGGDRYEDVDFEFFAPGESAPLRHSERSVIGLEETGSTMIEHVYEGVLLRAGEPYRLLVELDGRSNLIEWTPVQSGGTAIFIICNDPDAIAAGDGPGPISSAVTQIAQVATPEGAGGGATPAAPVSLQTNVAHLDNRSGCDIRVTDRTLDGDLNILITSSKPEDVDVRIYRPGEESLLPFSGRFKDETEETGIPFDWQFYESDDSWQGGTWTLEIRRDGNISRFTWQLENAGDQVINISCDAQELLLTLTPQAADSRQDGDASSSRPEATPAPPVMLSVGDTYRDAQSDCLVRLAPDSPGQDLDVVLSGERRHEVEVRVFQPGADEALPVSGRLLKALPDDELIIRQYYSGEQDWPWGLYRLEVELDGRVSAFLWRMETPTDQFFLVVCDESGAVSPTPTPAPSTPASEAAAPRLLETDVAWRDEHTGCDLLVSDQTLDGDLNIWITSPRPEDVDVRVYRPGESSVLPFDGRFRDEVEEVDLPLEWQYYESDESWPGGAWEFEVTLDGKTSRFAWQLENQGDQIITILCDTMGRDLSQADEPPDDQEEAQFSVEPTPPRVLEAGVFYRDDHSGCDIIISEEGLDGDLNLALAGDRYEDIEARVYRPGSDTALRFTDRLDDVFAESDEPFIWQFYSVTTPWDGGLYLLEVELDGRTTLAYWNLERGGDQLIYVFCNTEENQLPVASLTPTPGATATVTPSPTVTPTPTLTRTPVPTRVRELRTGRELRDYITGCEVYIDHEGLDGHLHLVFTGDRREEVEAVVYRPNGRRVEYTRQTQETFDDADERFVWQIYHDFGGWDPGLYRLVIALEDRTSEFFWDPEREGDQVIYVDCNGPVPRATVTPTPTLTWTPSPTLTPSPTPTPVPPEVEADLRTGAVHLDEATGCTLLVLEFSPEQVDWKDLWVTRGGSERAAVEVDVWLPDAERPLPVDEVSEDVMETGDYLIVQSYSPRTDWRNGLYRFDLRMGGEASSLTWRMSGPGYYAVSLTCDRAAGPAPSV